MKLCMIVHLINLHGGNLVRSQNNKQLNSIYSEFSKTLQGNRRQLITHQFRIITRVKYTLKVKFDPKVAIGCNYLYNSTSDLVNVPNIEAFTTSVQ